MTSNQADPPLNSETNNPSKQLLARYERIIEISQQLTSTLDHMSLLRRIVAAAMELTDSETASILLLDTSTGELRFAMAPNIDAGYVDSIVVPMDNSIAGWVVTHGEARVIHDVSKEPSFFRSVDEQINHTTRNLIAVPMRTHNKVIGALEALNKRGGERYNDGDVKILTTLAVQAAIAIENARLFQQSDFMAEMVHELRTPLMALKTSTVLLLRPDLPRERVNDLVLTMQGETERLIRLTSDFLDLARLESGRAKLEVSQFGLTKLVQECVDIVMHQAEARGIKITINDEGFTAFGDRGKIKQVLLNLLTNAIKYNRENGEIVINLYRSLRHDEPFVEIAVSDTGFGISKENQAHLFEKFFRIASTANRAVGTGLGLVIAKRIIESHRGLIWLESAEGQGSTFFVTLPLAQ
jgi:signal transduction histidine kinase